MKLTLIILSLLNFLAAMYGLSKIIEGDTSGLAFVTTGFNLFASIFCGMVYFGRESK